jgi:hypothetical protein
VAGTAQPGCRGGGPGGDPPVVSMTSISLPSGVNAAAGPDRGETGLSPSSRLPERDSSQRVIWRVFGTAGAGVTAAACRGRWTYRRTVCGLSARPRCTELGVDLGGVAEALVVPLADVRLELVQLRFPAQAGQQLIDAGRLGVPLHDPAVQAGGAADRGLRLPGAGPLADLGPAFPWCAWSRRDFMGRGAGFPE